MDLADIHALVKADFASVNAFIIHQLHTSVDLINELSQHIIHSGGKRLRPLLVLLSANACGYQGQSHIPIAAIVEFIHTATLLHDDVVDHSNLRRGKKTAHTIWGSEASVLVGDFLYSRAFQMMVAIPEKKIEVMKILADTTNTIAEGEVLQLLNCHNPHITESQYIEVIYRKTAKLFEAAAALGALISPITSSLITSLENYGRYLGNAFQIIDDALDYCADVNTIGKNIGDDLADGKLTLPLIYAMKQCTDEEKKLLEQIITQGDITQLDTILKIIESTNAIAYTYAVAKQQAQYAIDALAELPASDYQQALIELAKFAVARKY